MNTATKDKKILPIIIAFAVLAIVVGSLLAFGDRSSDSQAASDDSSSSMSDSSMSGSSMDGMSKSSDSSTSADTGTETTTATIDNYAFGPMAIKVKVGQTVTWTNKDTVKHNVVADTTSADAPNGPLIGRGETYSFTFKKAGTYSYHCDPHPYMKGTVVVTE